jgi:hypothetical protein
MSDEATSPPSEVATSTEQEKQPQPFRADDLSRPYPKKPYFPKPPEFDSREVCEATGLDGRVCQEPRATCTRHCGKWVKSRGVACVRAKLLNGCCAAHGGRTPKMQASPAYKGKGGSRYLPKDLQKQHAEIMARPDLLSLRSEIGLVQLRVDQLTEQLSTKASQAVFDDIGDLWRDFKVATANADMDELIRLRGEIDGKVRDGAAIGQKWGELIKTTKDKAYLSRCEIESMVDMHCMVSVEQVIMMLAELGDLVHRHVKDKAALAVITNELAGFLGRRPSKKPMAIEAKTGSV